MPLHQLVQIEEKLRKLARQMPELPATDVLILRAAIILGRDFHAVLERQLQPAGLSETEFRLLMGLRSHDGHATAGDLCAAMAQSPANLTRLSDALVERGLIDRHADPEDRRRMLLTLQPAGEQLVQSLLPRISQEISGAFAGFSAAEKKQLLETLKRLLAGVDAVASARSAPVPEESAS